MVGERRASLFTLGFLKCSDQIVSEHIENHVCCVCESMIIVASREDRLSVILGLSTVVDFLSIELQKMDKVVFDFLF